jgi:hypothetical protein
VIEPHGAALKATRVDLRGIQAGAARGAIAELARRIADAAPELPAGAIALVDSPRWPRDLDVARPGQSRGDIGGRSIDAALRAMVRSLIDSAEAPALRPLALFPTPCRAYFDACLDAPACKTHLRALGRELFDARPTAAPHGGTFTRFMVAGFAVYRALALMRVEACEAYPDLQFRLWSRAAILPPKRKRGEAREARRRIVAALANRIGIAGCDALNTLDALDAGILALSAAAARRDGTIAILEHRAEGRFMVAMDIGVQGWRQMGVFGWAAQA